MTFYFAQSQGIACSISNPDTQVFPLAGSNPTHATARRDPETIHFPEKISN